MLHLFLLSRYGVYDSAHGRIIPGADDVFGIRDIDLYRNQFRVRKVQQIRQHCFLQHLIRLFLTVLASHRQGVSLFIVIICFINIVIVGIIHNHILSALKIFPGGGLASPVKLVKDCSGNSHIKYGNLVGGADFLPGLIPVIAPLL